MDLNEKLESIRVLVLEMRKEEKSISKKVSKIDKTLSQLYHEIEDGKYGTGYKTMVSLQAVLRERRQLKDQHRLVQSAVHSVTTALTKFDKIHSLIKMQNGDEKGVKPLTLIKNL